MKKIQKISLALITVTIVLSLTACGKSQLVSENMVTDNGTGFAMNRTREYFENLDKDSSLEDIVADIGPYGVKGSGIIYHVWKLNDGTEAHVVFDSKGKIVMIYIIGDDNSERIYKREYDKESALVIF